MELIYLIQALHAGIDVAPSRLYCIYFHQINDQSSQCDV